MLRATFGAGLNAIREIGADSQDSTEERLQKRIFVTAIFLVMVATVLWGITYIAFGEPLVGALSLAYSVYTLLSLLIIRRTHRIRFIMYSQIFIGLVLPFMHHYLLGGFAGSSAVALWSVMSPLAALFFLEVRRALPWWLAYLALLVIAAFLQPLLRATNHLPPFLVTGFFLMNIAAVASIVLAMLNYFNQQKNEAYRLLAIEQEKAEDLLLNILPKEIAAILKNEKRTIADYTEGASILFADLVGFTPLTARMAPVEMVNLLNTIYSYFDGLVEKYAVEKIRTIGDNYMVASGAPRARPDHAAALARMALEMSAFICTLPPVEDKAIQFRIGINSGPVVGGVIGRKKFVYDLWGDAVNVASRMESQGVAGRIQITQHTYELIQDELRSRINGVLTTGKIQAVGRGLI